MLKFVSRKPPKGKAGSQHYPDYHSQETQAPKGHQTRLFRARASSGMKSPPSFDPLRGDKSHIHTSDNAGRDSLGYDATSESQTDCVYDNLDKVRERSRQIQENGQDISFDSSDLTRSRSPSNLSSESSPYGSLRKKHEKNQDPRRGGHGYRHVTWSPDVTNGDNLPMISEKYVSAPAGNLHYKSPYNLATRTYMADDYVHKKPDLSHIRYTVGNVKDCIQTVPGPDIQGSGRTVNMAEQFRGDKRTNVSDLYTSHNKPMQSTSLNSTDSNLSDIHIGPRQFPRDLDQSLGEQSLVTDGAPNYAYYTTLPANFSMRSNFVFSPRVCSTPIKDLSKTKDRPRLKVIIPPKDSDFLTTNQHTFQSHVTNPCASDGVTIDGNDEYDNIATDQIERHRRKTSDMARQDVFKADNISITHQDGGPSQQSKTNYHGLFTQSEPNKKEHHIQRSKQPDKMDHGQKHVRRGFPRLFLPKEKTPKKAHPESHPEMVAMTSGIYSQPAVSGHPITGTTTTKESTGFQDKRDGHYHHFDSLVRAPRIIPESKKVETGPVLYQQIQKGAEGPGKGGHLGKSYMKQPPTHTPQERQERGQYSVGRFKEQTSSHKVMTSCVPQVNHEVKHESVKKYQYSPREPPASGSNTPGTNMSTLRDMINRAQVEDDQLVLDLVYITERIISMSFPSDEHEVTYTYNLKEVMNMLRTKHDDNCLVINLSEPRQDLEKFNPKHVIDYGWPDYLAPPLERLCNICKAMDSWLSTDGRHVVVVHCKGSTSRIAVVIAAFMHYCSICASADQALDRFAMKRFYDDKLGGITLPSQIRYVEYFYGLLSGAIKINSNALYLHHIVIHGVPNFDTQGGCRPFIKVYQGMQNIFTSGVYNVTDQMQKVCISISPGIPLRGDIMIKCYHKKAKTGQREVVWACQFHTCAISGYTLTFAKKDLDDARSDPRFPDTGKVEFVFGNSQDSNVRVTDFKSDVTVPVDDGTDALVRWDSYENFSNVKNTDGKINDVNENSVTSSSREGATHTIRDQHSQGPVDGSLYATVTKRKHEHVETTSSTLFQNGTSHDQQNGSHTSSVDSGISASSSGIAGNTSSNMNTTSTSVNITPQYTANVNNNDTLHQSFSSTLNSSKSSYNNGVSGGQKKSVPPLDEQTQLDMILSDLLNDSVFVSPQSPPKSGANSVSKDTRTFRTYDTQSTPDGKTMYQTAEVTYKIPGGYKEERNYSMTKTEEKSYVPKNAFSYTSGPTSPELQRKAESPKTHSLPYRTDYDNRYYSNNESTFNRTMDSSRSMSPNEQTSSWLQEQQQKLRQRKDSKDEKTVQQERQLVEELKTAQNKYFMKRAHNQAEEQATMDTYRSASSPPPVANGPVSSSYTVTQNHTYSTDRSAHEPVRSFSPPSFTGDSFYSTSYKSTSTSSTQKPPPSPGQQRAPPPITSPVTPPVRTSSKDFMQRSRNTSTSSWQGRVGSKEPEQDIKPAVIRAISVTTPPQSPRPFSPVQKQQTYQVSSTRTMVEQQPPQRDQQIDIQMTLPVHAPTKTKVTEVQEFSHPEGQKKSHYITEVYVHRTAGADGTGTTQRSTTAEQKEKVEKERNRLEELEKSLQAASNSIIATTPWQQQQKSYSTTERQVTRRVETRKYETQNFQQQQQQQQTQSVSSYDGQGEVPPLSPPPHQRSTSPEWDNMNMHGSFTVERGNEKVEYLPRRLSDVNNRQEMKFNSLPRSEVSENSETSEVGTQRSFVEVNSALNNLLGELTAWTKESPDMTLNYDLDSLKVTADNMSSTENQNLKSIDQKQEMVEVSPTKLSLSKSHTGQKGDNFNSQTAQREDNSFQRNQAEMDVHWGSCSRRSSKDELEYDSDRGNRDFVLGTRSREELLWGSNSRRGSRDEILSHDGSRRGSRDEMLSHDGSRRGSRDEILPHDGSQRGSRDEILSHDGSRRGSRDKIQSRDGSRRSSRDEVEAGQKVDVYIATSQQVATPQSLVASEFRPHREEVLTDDEIDVSVPSFGFHSETVTNSAEVCPVTGARSAERREQHVAVIHDEQPGLKRTQTQQCEHTTSSTHVQPEVTIHQRGNTTNWSSQMTSQSNQLRQTGQFVQENVSNLEPMPLTRSAQSSGKHECTINVPGQGELSADQLGMLHTYLTEGGSSLKTDGREASVKTATTIPGVQVELANEATGSSNRRQAGRQEPDLKMNRGTSEFDVDENGHYSVVDRSQMSKSSNRQQYVTSDYQTIDSVQGLENTTTTNESTRFANTTGMRQKHFLTSEYQTIDSKETTTLTKSNSQAEFTVTESNTAADEVIYSQVIKKKNQVQAIAPPPPKQISVVEEDKISLRPIGPGVQTLEPEGMGTMGRSGATTPSFPVSPVASAEQFIQAVQAKVRRLSLGSNQDLHATPPFPVSPRTPYYNQAPTPTLSPSSPFASYDKDEAYNNMVARQICRGSDPLYASIPEDVGGLRRSGIVMTTATKKVLFKYEAKMLKTSTGSVSSPFNTVSSTTSQHHLTQHHQQHQMHHQQPPPPQQHQVIQQQQQHQQQQYTQQQQHQQQPFPQQPQHQQQQFTQQQQHQQQQYTQQQQHQQQQHQQHQYQYQQEYHTGGRHQSGSVSSQDAGHILHVDTSPRMISPGGSMARTPTSPPSPSSLNTLRQQLSVGGTMSPTSHSMTGQSSPSLYFGTSRRGSISSLAESEPAHITTPRFVKDMSKYWYKPQITREDAIMLLKDKQPGAFVVRDSNSYPGAFGLALKVAQIPPNVQTKSTGDPSADLVRHFLIEPTHKGVRLRGSNNEPIFGSLASLVYQHSNTPLSLPCKLVLPDAETVAMESSSSTMDSSVKTELPSSAAALLAQGAACNVLFLNSVDTESLTGPQAVARAMKVTFDTQPTPKTTVVHFKVSNQGITLTDNQRKLFFRRHYPVSAVTYCGMDPDGRKWKRETESGALMEARVFGFVARKSGGHSDNACHLFAEVDPEQPASAIVNFVTKIMIGQSGKVKP
ncbi:uncharacterized protein LOC132555421 [Ylistrum balloti]|uniref:uncharacterized protein LOC132555421 n=1 Tax=Ylistrum balloti TaxID=509963 RepID=UPI00290599C9|nr:uncharacterized protein LOC132555421 [Ylistrum balloti]